MDRGRPWIVCFRLGGRARAKRQERLPGAVPFLSRYFLGDLVRFVCTNKTHELPGQTPAQHLLNIYLYIMNIPMHQQWQTQLRISNEGRNNANNFVHAHKGASRMSSARRRSPRITTGAQSLVGSARRNPHRGRCVRVLRGQGAQRLHCGRSLQGQFVLTGRERRGIGARRALRGPRERFVGVQGWPRGMCDRLLATCPHVSVVGLGPGARFAVECPFAVLAVVAVTRRAV